MTRPETEIHPDAGRPPWTTCADCGKRGYPARATARKARRSTAGGHLAVYRCSSGLWHIGHRVPGRPRDHYAGRFGTAPFTQRTGEAS